MRVKQRLLIAFLLAAFLICGCAHLPYTKSPQQFPVVGLPEDIFVWPKENPFKHSRVKVCWFGEPAYARGTGSFAARTLVDLLLTKRVFSQVSMEQSDGCEIKTCVNDRAGSQEYDLMITGDVTHYMDGSVYMAAHVTERISVVHVPTGLVLWSASANSRSEPAPIRDYILFQTKGAPAEPASVLIERNAAKFCNMLLRLPAQTMNGGHAYRPMLRDHRLALDVSQEKVQHLQLENELLEEQLLKTVENGKALQEEVDALSAQADQLENQLKEEIDKGEITLKRHKTKTIINIDNRICFDSGSAVLKGSIKRSLKKISKTLMAFPDNNIRIEGHTDNVPIRSRQFPSNWELSSSRALAVLRFLVDQSKIDPGRLSAAGYGEYQPVGPNDTAKTRKLNRRVDIVILPTDT